MAVDLFDRIIKDKGPLGKWAKQAEGYYVFPKLEGPISNRMKFQGKEVITWSINDYLGLANLPEIKKGDKRILIIDGEAVPYGLARIPSQGELRGNLAAGGRGEAQPLTDRDYWIVDQIKDDLRARGLLFVGIDVIGDYLTEINVTSPTCIQEIDKAYDTDIAGRLMATIENHLNIKSHA